MHASRKLSHGDPRLIIVPEDRQRKMDLDIGDLIPSVRRSGILLPLLVKKDLTLIAGWRRLKTALHLELKEVPYRVMEGDITERAIRLIEFEENARRKDLTWQDRAAALRQIHILYSEENGEAWSVADTAMAAGFHEEHVRKMIDLGEALADGDESVAKAETIANATTLLSRRRSRATNEALNRILEVERLPVVSGVQSSSTESGEGGPRRADGGSSPATLRGGEQTGDRGDSVPDIMRPVEPPYAIIPADLTEFVAGYTGPRFNFLHADLPYGVELNAQANQAAFEGGGYDSSPEIYWNLTEAILGNWERFMFPGAHIMWWFAFKFRAETEERIHEALGPKGLDLDVRINPIPLVWHKTDNRGILSDPNRGPRNIGEYALLISTGDRKIVKPVSNIYGAPTSKAEAIHTNEKPEPMLRHFFSMLVDGHSRVLDPTAGSGSAIRVAESLSAEAALGLEFNPEFAERAQSRLLQARSLAKLSAKISAATTKAAEEVLALIPANSQLDSKEEA